MIRKLLLTITIFLFTFAVLFAQSGSIEGTVTDGETEEVLPGANVFIQQLQRGASTNANGEFLIENIPSGTYTIRVTFVGFQDYNQQIQVGTSRVTLDISLEPGSIGLDELVVTGYGTTTKRELTGSITKVSASDFKDVPVQNTESILQGRASGVQVTSTSGNPGGGFEVRVRGAGSINAGSDPLYIVDGVQLDRGSGSELNDVSPLNSIPTSDIESIEVLKDASAAAIYGSQAANGVVIITTKRGVAGDTQVNARIERGVRSPINTYDELNTSEWIDFHVEALGEEAVRDELPGFGFDRDTPFNQLPNFDWQDFVYRDAPSQKYNISVSGGDEKTRFFVSGNYELTEGQIQESSFERFNLRTNLDHDITSKLSTSLNVNLTNSSLPGICQDGFFINCPVSQALFEPPVVTPFTEDGEINPNTSFGRANNLFTVFNEEQRETNVTAIVGNIEGTYDITSNLSVRALFGMDYRFTRDTDVESPIADPGRGGSVSENLNTNSNFNTNVVLNYRNTFNEVHSISGLLGGEYRRVFERETQAIGVGLPVGVFEVISAAAEPNFVQGFNTENRIAGYFSTLRYNYDTRYFLTLTGRYDGSSRFGEDNRWGFFPSISGAWAISEEDFFNVSVIDDLKLRASFGINGNQSIGNFDSRALFQVAGSYRGTSGLDADQLANSDLTWEEAREINLGVDWSLWKGRFSGSLDVYKRTNDDLLLDRPLQRDTGFDAISFNVGTVENQGIEFEFETVNMNQSDFFWSSRFNIAVQKNEITELSEGLNILQPGQDVPLAVGHSLGAFRVEDWAGVNPADGRPLWYDADGNLTYQPQEDDLKFFDGAEQDVIGGLGNTFNYKGLSLDVFFQYSFGGTATPRSEFNFARDPSFFGVLQEFVEDRWREPGDIAPQVRNEPSNFFTSRGTASIFTEGDNAYFSTSYIRLKNITLSYNLPASLLEKINLRGVRFYATALNLATWTSWPGLDPEVAGGVFVPGPGQNLAGQTESSFPSAKQVSGGIELQF